MSRPALRDGNSCRHLTLRVQPGATVNFGPEHVIASDTVVLIYSDAELLGWADDYGTVEHPDHELDPDVREMAERFVEAACDLWTKLDERTPA